MSTALLTNNKIPGAGVFPDSFSEPFERISLLNSVFIQCDMGDPEFRMIGWEKLKEIAAVGPLNIPMMMKQVE